MKRSPLSLMSSMKIAAEAYVHRRSPPRLMLMSRSSLRLMSMLRSPKALCPLRVLLLPSPPPLLLPVTFPPLSSMLLSLSSNAVQPVQHVVQYAAYPYAGLPITAGVVPAAIHAAE